MTGSAYRNDGIGLAYTMNEWHGKKQIKQIPLWGILVSLALILSFIESLIPFYFGIPGMKLGLCNAIVVMLLYLSSAREALLVNLCRIVLAGFLFGNGFSILYSMGGALLSFLCMWIVYRTGLFTITTVSIVGGLTHNIGQLCVASAVLENINIFWYAPALMLAGAVTGAVIGVLVTELIPRLEFLFLNGHTE